MKCKRVTDILQKNLYNVLGAIGLILLIIPGIIVSFMFLFFDHVIVDWEVGPIEALKVSKIITDGAKWDLLLFNFLLAIINIAGMLAFGVGLFITVPLFWISSAYLYRKLLYYSEFGETFDNSEDIEQNSLEKISY